MYKKKKKYRSDIRSFEEIKFKKLEKFISKDGKLKFLNYQKARCTLDAYIIIRFTFLLLPTNN